jgi:hypothetical protein
MKSLNRAQIKPFGLTKIGQRSPVVRSVELSKRLLQRRSTPFHTVSRARFLGNPAPPVYRLRGNERLNAQKRRPGPTPGASALPTSLYLFAALL